MRILDLFCGAGGAAMGYARAFPDAEIVGVDINPQPNYPFEFWQADALEFIWQYAGAYDLVHASPPCQSFTAYRRKDPTKIGASYPDLIDTVRDSLHEWNQDPERPLHYVIENVVGAPLINPVQLCGSSFNLDVRRHRLFEASFPIIPASCNHAWQTPRFPPATNRTNLRSTVEVGVWRIPLDVQQQAMGIDWMERHELSQAIPPAYTEHIGRSFAKHLAVNA